jgi:hypothetical protein
VLGEQIMTQFNGRLRVSTFVAALAVVGTLAGCSDAPPERAGTVNESASPVEPSAASSEASSEEVELDAVGRQLTDEQAKAALPAVSTLPTGWSVDPENTLNDESDDEDSKATIEPAECQAIMDGLSDQQKDEPTGKASRTYMAGMLGPFMGVEISSFADEVPDDVFTKTLDALTACPEFTSTEDGVDTTFKTSSLSFPNLGEESAAIRMAATADGMPVGLDMVFIRAGHTIVTVSTATVGAGSAGEAMEKVARATVTNLEKG